MNCLLLEFSISYFQTVVNHDELKMKLDKRGELHLLRHVGYHFPPASWAAFLRHPVCVLVKYGSPATTNADAVSLGG